MPIPGSGEEAGQNGIKTAAAGKMIVVDDHFSKREEPTKNTEDEAEDDEFVVHDVNDGLNDRGLELDGASDSTAIQIKSKGSAVKLLINTQKRQQVDSKIEQKEDGEEDNILRNSFPPSNKANKKQKNVTFDTNSPEKATGNNSDGSPKSDGSPTSPESPESPGAFG